MGQGGGENSAVIRYFYKHKKSLSENTNVF